MNVCVLGDSIAKGVVFDEEKRKYGFSKNCFVNLISERDDINIKSYAKFGSTIAKGSETLDKHRDEIGQYDYVVLEFGGNDCDLPWQQISEAPEIDHPPMVSLENFTKIYKDMIEKVLSFGSKPVIMSLVPLDAGRFFDWVSKGLNKTNILKYLGDDVNYIYRWHENYNDRIYKIGAEYQVPVIDIRGAFLTEKSYKTYLCADGMHPNERGHRQIAAYIEAYLKKCTDIFAKNGL